MFAAAPFTVARTQTRSKCPSTDEWIHTLWFLYTMKYYSAIKKNAFQSVLMMWLNLEPMTQSEASQKEKDKYCIFMHAYLWNLERWYWWTYLQGSNGDTDLENTFIDLGVGVEGEGGTNGESSVETYITIWKIDSKWELLCDTGSSTQCSVEWCPRGVGWGGKWEGGFRREGTYVYLWLTHVDVWQTPTRYCKAIILQ